MAADVIDEILWAPMYRRDHISMKKCFLTLYTWPKPLEKVVGACWEWQWEQILICLKERSKTCQNQKYSILENQRPLQYQKWLKKKKEALMWNKFSVCEIIIVISSKADVSEVFHCNFSQTFQSFGKSSLKNNGRKEVWWMNWETTSQSDFSPSV